MSDRLIAVATAAYPSWWRERYGPELDRLTGDVLASGASRAKVTVDLVLGGVRVHLHATGMPAIPALWAERTKWSLFFATLPWLVVSLPLQWAIASGFGDAFSQVHRTGGALVASRAWQIEVLASAAMIVAVFRIWLALFGKAPRERSGSTRPRASAALLLPCAVITAGYLLSSDQRGAIFGLVMGPWAPNFLSLHRTSTALVAAGEAVVVVGGVIALLFLGLILRRANPSAEAIARGHHAARALAIASGSQVLVLMVAEIALWPSIPWSWVLAVTGLAMTPVICGVASRQAARSMVTWEQLLRWG